MDPLRIIPFDEFYDFNKEKKGEGDWKSLGKHGEIDKEHLLILLTAVNAPAAFWTDAPTKESPLRINGFTLLHLAKIFMQWQLDSGHMCQTCPLVIAGIKLTESILTEIYVLFI